MCIPGNRLWAFLLILNSFYLVEGKDAVSAEKNVAPVLQPYPLTQVRLLDGDCKEDQELTRKYLHELDADRLLYSYRLNAGLPAPGQPLGGWESPSSGFSGAFLGHYLSACAMMSVAADDEGLKLKADGIVTELARCQQALGGGYLAAFPAVSFDALESDEHKGNAQYYKIHKMIAGLLDMYRLCGNTQALEMCKRLADYFDQRIARLSQEQWKEVLLTREMHPTREYGGMADGLCGLYEVTGDSKYLALAQKFLPGDFIDPLTRRENSMTGRHANTHLPVILGAGHYYELTGEERYRTVSYYAWDTIVDSWMYATGGINYSEHWTQPRKLANTLGERDQEFCQSYQMVKLSQMLLCWTGEPKYADYSERIFFNRVLANINPRDSGLYWYFTPMMPGTTRMVSINPQQSKYDAFWCCYGTSIESFAKLAEGIYLHDDRDVYVNLFVASRLNWAEKGLVLEQQTKFPEEDSIRLTVTVDKPTSAGIHIHIPYWAKKGAAIKINDKPVQVESRPGSFLPLTREWRTGDIVEIRLPMQLHICAMPDDPDLMAFMYGPIVLAGLTDNDAYLLGDTANLDSWIRPVEGRTLTFRTSGQVRDIEFIPLNQIIDQHYTVYFVVARKGSARHEQLLAKSQAQKEFETRTVDRIIPNNAESESGHNLQQEKSQSGGVHPAHAEYCTDLACKIWALDRWTTASGYLNLYTQRAAEPGGWWSWDLKVLPDQPMNLVCTYWQDDTRQRVFDILVDDTAIASVSLAWKDGEFTTAEYPIPEELTRGKEMVTVRFRASGEGLAGPVYECFITRK